MIESKHFLEAKEMYVMTHYLQGYLALFQCSELHTMMIESKMFQDEFMKINNILSVIRNNDTCQE